MERRVLPSPDPWQAWAWFQEYCGDDAWLNELRPASEAFSRRRIYTLGVVVRLMMLQWLLPKLTLSEAVQQLVGSRKDSGSKSGKAISPRPAAYCKARQKLPTLVADRVLEQIVERLRGWLPANPVLPDRSVFVLDGSTLLLPPSPALAAAYPPHNGPKAGSHWPLLRLAVLQDVQTGLALRPQWGPETVSEQALGLETLAQLPPAAAVIGDRNFGIFGVAWAAHRHGHPALLRLTRERAERLAGEPLAAGFERLLTWKPSRWDRCGGPYAPDAAVTGQLVCLPATASPEGELLYLFSTLDLPADRLAALYALRWNVETDLRSIKQTVRLQEISARSPQLLEKELLLAFAAYNLVRAVICLAAEKAQAPPRRLSFTNVYTLVETFLPQLAAAPNRQAWTACWEHIIDLATCYFLPQRSKRRSYPRAIWPKGKSFPSHHSPRS